MPLPARPRRHSSRCLIPPGAPPCWKWRRQYAWAARHTWSGWALSRRCCANVVHAARHGVPGDGPPRHAQVINGLAHVAQTGSVVGFAGREDRIAPERFWNVDCDILIPAALEQQITNDNAGQIRARIILEGANGPATPEAGDILRENGVLVVPDVIANAGGVTVSYVEWVQDFSSFFWSEEDINARLTRIMRDAFAAIWQVAQDKDVSLRTAAFVVACTRVLQARGARLVSVMN
ncbi:hypothetical protein F2P44_25340 [Massilia sp. CCM 8695]|uniref:Glutamate/phenylalanine/leucine/valine/L-tryptophan dehydrogenase C-terminal domain-containing protein n=1 Tax=Massilia frigida TaxID=2609281 RepID=A0ABX0NAV8_9BURK|nr:hypothetical protein [Massilia frigida]